MTTIAALRANVYNDDHLAIKLTGYASGMLLGYRELETRPDKVDRLIEWETRYRDRIFDDRNHTDYDVNFAEGKLAAYRRFKEELDHGTI